MSEAHRFELTPWQRELIVNAYPDPLAVLDFIERLNDLPDGSITVEGTPDDGQSPTGPTEPEIETGEIDDVA